MRACVRARSLRGNRDEQSAVGDHARQATVAGVAMIWVFVWLLVAGGSQFSDAYATQQACEAARVAVEKVGANTHGQPIEKTYRCVPLR
jgi:hypothetical protein